MLHEIWVNKISFGRIQKIHHCQDITTTFKSLQIMFCCGEYKFSKCQLNFIIRRLLFICCWLICFLESLRSEFFIVQYVKINSYHTLCLWKLWVLFCFKTALQLIKSLLFDWICLIFQHWVYDSIFYVNVTCCLVNLIV